MKKSSLVGLSFVLGLMLTAPTRGGNPAEEKGKQDPARDAGAVFTPELARLSLEVQGRAVKPLRVSPPTPPQHRVGDLAIQIEGATARALKVGESKAQWTAKRPGEVELAWLAADELGAYLAGFIRRGRFEIEQPESPLRVHRLELQTGKWLEDLAFEGKPGPKQGESVLGATIRSSRIVFLTATTNNDRDADGAGQLVSYRVSCFKAGASSPLWSKSFPSAGKLAQPGVALLWAGRSPERYQADVQPLTWLGDDILVCAGPVQDILCLEGDTGKLRWRVERIWELERRFMGPSIWSYSIGPSKGADDEKEEKPEGGAKRLRGRQFAIVGGPVVVDLPRKPGEEGDHSIFVAVAKGPRQYAGYLSDCVIYELGADGSPLAMATLPRMIRGGWYWVQNDGVVWACQGGAFFKLGISRHRSVEFGGPDGPDLLCRIDWYRHPSAVEHDAWLTSDPAGDPVAFSDAFAFRVPQGGYVTDPKGEVYRFPLAMLDMKTGTDRPLELHVPYKGKFPLPQTNYRGWGLPQGLRQVQTFGPYLLAVTRLQVENKRLQVTLGMDKWSETLEFDIDELRERK